MAKEKPILVSQTPKELRILRNPQHSLLLELREALEKMGFKYNALLIDGLYIMAVPVDDVLDVTYKMLFSRSDHPKDEFFDIEVTIEYMSEEDLRIAEEYGGVDVDDKEAIAENKKEYRQLSRDKRYLLPSELLTYLQGRGFTVHGKKVVPRGGYTRKNFRFGLGAWDDYFAGIYLNASVWGRDASGKKIERKLGYQ